MTAPAPGSENNATEGRPTMDTTSSQAQQQQEEDGHAVLNGDTSLPLHEKRGLTSPFQEQLAQQQQQQAQELKSRGNTHFNHKEYDKACRLYKEALDLVVTTKLDAAKENGDTPPPQSSLKPNNNLLELEVALRANLAIVLLKMQRYMDAQLECTKALDLDPSNAKVWYRRGLAREALSSNNTDNGDSLPTMGAAISDLQQCLSLFPTEPNVAERKMMAAASDALKRIETTRAQRQKQKTQQKHQGDTKATPCATTTNPSIPPPERQRQDVIRLLMARRQVLGHEETQHSCCNNTPLDGEAYFLLNWSWWTTWCRHVDLFYVQQQQDDKRVGKRQRDVLKLLPPGSSIPQPKKRQKSQNTADSLSSSSSSEEEQDDGDDRSSESSQNQVDDDVPKVIDNSCLLVSSATPSPQDAFYQQWNPHLMIKQQRPESVENNTCLLLPNLVRGYHYELLPREVYFALRVWYGEVTSTICRRVIVADPDKTPKKMLILPLYPEHTKIANFQQLLGGPLCGACHKPVVKARCTRCHTVHYCDRSCQESHWPYHKFACKKLAMEANANENNQANSTEDDEEWGRVGLNNLGNTCFMNSAIQCLSHATPLTRLFLSNRFKADLNSQNPLGTGGKLAHAYDAVMKDIWMGGRAAGKSNAHSSSTTSPTALKRAIAMFAPRFAGCSQHDAQEFLAYLLDGLHEDLNRIRKAPYVEMPTVAGQNMAIAGAEAWDAHRRRNDSLVMDTFYGQFKSTCVCPKCERVSVSFDAFNHVSLEIPQFHNTTRTIPVLVVRPAAAPQQKTMKTTPTRYGVTVRRNEFVGDLRRALSELCRIPTTRLAICDVYEHAIYEILQDGKPVSAIRGNDVLAAYEVDPYTNTTIHAIASNTTIESPSKLEQQEEQKDEEGGGKVLFGFPFLASFDAQLSCKEVWDHLWGQVRLVIGNDDRNGNAKASTEAEEETNEIENDEKKVEDEHENGLRNLLQIRVVDNTGTPRPVFLDEGLSNVETNGVVDTSSILPRESDEKIVKFLGKDCTERFLFVQLEWDVPASPLASNEDSSRIPSLFRKDRFLSFVDHPSLAQGLQKQRSMMNGAKGVTIEQCFETFTRPERLDEHNKWYCSRCKEHVRAMKTMELWRLPNILVVHLKRFEFKHALRRDKLDTLVDFPLEGLDMSKHCAASSSEDSECNGDVESGDHQSSVFEVEDGVPAVYDLFAVTNHYGRMGFGHYTAFARKWNEEGMSHDWALFDDSSVRSVGDGRGRNGGQGVVSSAAYVLFYRRRVFN